MGRRKQRQHAPAEPRSANIDPLYAQWVEMHQMAANDSRGWGMTYTMQRALARTPHIGAIKQTFINWGADFAQPQLSPYSIGWRVAKSDRRTPYTRSDWKIIDEISGVIQRAGWDWFPGGFEAFVKSSINDTLVHDQCNWEIIREEFGGKPWAFIPVDPATIRRAIPSDEDLADFRWDYDEIAFVQVLPNGSMIDIVAEFTREELGWGIRRNTSWIHRLGYGMPELEEYAGIIAHIINCITSAGAGITTGVNANQLIWILSKMPREGRELVKMEMQAMLSGPRNNKRTPILFGNPDFKDEIKSVPLGQTNEEAQLMAWMDFLESIICAIYNVEKKVVFPKATDTDSPTNPNLSPTDRALLTKERGFRPVLRSIATWLNESIVSWWPGFRFDFVGFDSQSERDKLEMDIKAVGTYLSPNELRAERNLPPYDDPISNRPLNALYQAWIQQQIEADQPIPGLETDIDNISAWVNGRRLPEPTAPA